MDTFRIWPEAESVMVLGGDDDSLESGELGSPHPLPAVKGIRSEHVLRLCPVTPFLPRKGIGSEMDEHIGFHLLPRYL